MDFWTAFYRFAFVDWVVVEDTLLVLAVWLVWKLYREVRALREECERRR